MKVMPFLFFNTLIGSVLLAVTAGFYLAGTPAVFTLPAISVMVVLTIIFGEKLEDLPLACRILPGDRPAPVGAGKLLLAFSTREAMSPAFVMLGCLLFNYVDLPALQRAVIDKAQIIFLILTFAVIAYGVKQSGYFKYAAFRVLEVCDGNMTRMILYMFLLSSVLTYFTSNDIVILVMTPIILEICRQSHIRNARLLLLGQFVAANTLSMGLLIGSPTNIIVALSAGINFVDYFLLMAIPSALAIAVSFLALHFINSVFAKWISRVARPEWEHDVHYIMPALVEQPDFSPQMRSWVIFFAVAVGSVAVISQFELSLFWVTVPTFTLGVIAIYATLGTAHGRRANAKERRRAVGDCLTSLPYSIIPFALVFFAIAESFAAEISFPAIFDWLFRMPLAFNSIATMGGVAVLVNTVNDLPASAIVGESLAGLQGAGVLGSGIFIQSAIVALNIACYITPVGALAGIIWFHIMGQERKAAGSDILTPTRMGMVVYGVCHFSITASVLSVLIPMINIVSHWMIGRGEKSFTGISDTELSITTTAGIIIAIGAALLISNILAGTRVAKSPC